MEITITVVNVRGCADAHLECAPVALLAGPNAAGKSSIAQAVAAALTGQTMPVPGIDKRAMSALVRSGAGSGAVEVIGPDGHCTVEWPNGRIVAQGEPPQARVYAVGLESLPLLSLKERSATLAEYIRANPTKDELRAALVEKGISGEAVEVVWPRIEQDGWDGAHAHRRERGQQLKGQWRQATGANYGSNKAASWRDDLADLNETELMAAVANAQSNRDRALTAQAVSAAERDRIEGIANEHGKRTVAMAEANRNVDDAVAIFKAAQEARGKLPTATQPRPVKCPHCGQLVEIVSVGLIDMKLEPVFEHGTNDDGLRERRMAIAEADGKLAHANDDVMRARAAVARAQELVREADAARERLANWPRAVETGTDINAAEAALTRAKKRLDEWRTKVEADTLHQRIEGNEIVMGLLAGDGLRAKKLAERLGVFNARLDKLSDTADWSLTRVDEGAAISYGGRLYPLLSTSEQFRCRVVLALAMAEIDGSDMVVIDGADVLDPPARGGLFDLLHEFGKCALVCMTLAKRIVPDLGELGNSYWVEGGTANELFLNAEAA